MLRIVPLLLALGGCDRSSSPDRSDGLAYARALETMERSAAEGLRACAAVRDPELQADCHTAAAELLAAQDPDRAGEICAGLDPGLWQDECWFQLAERAGRPEFCQRAGRFAEDCRMHLWTAHLVKLLPQGSTPAGIEATIRQEQERYAFSTEDDRPWVAAFRLLGGRMRPLDRSGCDALQAARLRTICRDSMGHYYNDLLNHARDTGSFPCDGGPLPERLQHTPDPELDALIASRREGDLCP